MIFRILDFYCLSDLGCPDFVGTTGLGCCIPPCFFVILATGWERTLICCLESCGTREWCFRAIYKGGPWEEDLYYVSTLKRVSPVLGFR